MAEPKKLDIGKFFSGSFATSSDVNVNRTNVPAEPVVISGSDLSHILQIIKNKTELTEVQELKIIRENRDDRLLQGMVGSLQQRFISLQRGFTNLSTQFQLELQSRKREVDKQERLLLSQYSESTKTNKQSTGSVNKSSNFRPFQTIGSKDGGASGDNKQVNNSLLGALGMGALAAAIESQQGGSTESSESSGSSGKWKPLLDLIGSGEGGYESINPNDTIPGLSKMTILDAYNASETYRKTKGGSGAIGKYQLVSDPIGRAKAAGLNPNTDLFSPANQDKIAVYIIEKLRRGNDWISGKIKDEQFSEELSNEWGALKSASGNVLPGNSGNIGFDKIQKALKEVKGNQSMETSANTPKGSTQIASFPEKESTPPGQTPSSQLEPSLPTMGNVALASYTPPSNESSPTPIFIPAGTSQQTMPSEQISSGSAIPPGYSKNFNNPYPDVVQAQFNILV